MATGPLTKITAATAAAVCIDLELDEESRKLLREHVRPAEFLDALIAKELWIDACRFLAMAMPKREAIWWAIQCAKLGPELPPDGAEAVQAAEKWLLEKNEANRRACQGLSEKAGIGTPAGLAALAVFTSGGSIVAPDLPAVLAPDHITGTVVGNAAIMAALLPTPVEANEKFPKLLALGVEIAKGTNRWKEPPPPPAAKSPAPARAKST
jgi:hypothetical protein